MRTATTDPKEPKMTICCITNDVDDLRSCTYRDSHLETCDGFQWVFVEKRDRFEATGKACKGCKPRKAQEGFVCRGCYMSIVSAIAAAPALIRELARIDRAVMPDTAGRHSSAAGFVPIPATRLAVDEISRWLAHKPGSLEMWVSNSYGAETAIRFARAVRSASLVHPLREVSHQIQRTRCPDCNQYTLVWHPVAYETGNVVVKCRDPKCCREIDQDHFEILAGIEAPAPRTAVDL